MLYDISLAINYKYEAAADGGRHVFRMMPKDIAGIQRVVAASPTFTPAPAEWVKRTDFFGNDFIEADFVGSQSEMTFGVRARVERLLTEVPEDRSISLPELKAGLENFLSVEAASPLHFLGPSARIKPAVEITAYAMRYAGDLSVMRTVSKIGNALHSDMKFDAKATTVDTPVLDAFRKRRGVCQDFTHVMITALRSLGIPAGYVSGFLRTDPPLGKPRLEGADAMHAWVQAWCGPDAGWIEYDPTNNCFALVNHIVVARGRDYSDVSPVRGLTRMFGEQKSTQKVTVTPLA